jgi:hypothetical protein
VDDLAIARWRMSALRLSSEPYASVPEVVTGLLGVQAENHSQASWAVATRSRSASVPEFARLFDEGAFLRTHVLRPTWHYVSPDDIRWLMTLTAPRIRKPMEQMLRSLGLEEHQVRAAHDRIAEMLSGGAQLTRAEIGERLRADGIPAEGQRLAMVMFSAETSLLVCNGAMCDGSHTYALLEERVPPGRSLDHDEALAEVALRYFTGHGPATERDLSYWATMTVTDVRAGLAQVSDRLERFEHDGRTYWHGTDPPPDSQTLQPRGHLLQILDEAYRGYQDSRHVIDAAGLEPRGRGASIGMALVDGQMVGDMRRTLGPGEVVFEIGLFRPLDEGEVAAVHDAAARYGAFLDREPRVVMSS